MPLGKDYRIIADLGRGGMADVFLAVARGPGGFNKLLVLKLLRRSLANDPDFHEMFMNEARLAARLNHPNVVQTYEVTEEQGRPVIVMEYLEGQPLSAIRHRSRARPEGLPLPLHLRIIADALNGLHHAHELRDFDGSALEVVHRDATPQNIFVTFDGQVKMLDFGIAKASITASETRAGVVKGKVHYMSPEQMGGFAVDRRTDVFAIGVVLWEALTGRRLWTEPDVAVMTMMLQGDVAPPRSVNPEVPEELEELCMRALAMNPAARFQTAAEFEAALDHYLATLEEPANAKKVGQYVSELFADVREEVAQIVAREIKKVEELPEHDFRTLQSTAVPSIASIAKTVVTQDGAQHSISEQIITERYKARRARQFATVALSLLLVGVVSFFWFGRFGRDDTPTAAVPIIVPSPVSSPPATATSTPVPEAAAPEPVLIEVRVEATPKRAKLFFDGEPLQGNPSKFSRPQDQQQHTIRAEAFGYQREELEIGLQEDAQVRIDLKPLRTGHRPGPGPTAGATTTVRPGCANPWYVDKDGVKRIKIECL